MKSPWPPCLCGARSLLLLALIAFLPLNVLAETPPPLTMQQAIRMAVDRSPDIAAARAAQREAAAAAAVARSVFRPSSTLSTTPGYATGLPVSVLGSIPAIASIEAHQTLYDNSARVDLLSAEAQADERKADIDAATRQTSESTAQAYAKYTADLAVLADARTRAEAVRTQLARVTAILAEGRVTELDVDRARLQVDRADNQVDAAARAAAIDEQLLRRLTGWDTPGAIQVATSELQPPAGGTADHVAAATSRDASLRAIDRQLDTLRQSVSILRRPFQPTVQAQTQYARLFDRYAHFYRDYKPDDFSVAASVVIPLWSGGRRAASVDRATAQLQRLEAQRASRLASIDTAVRDAESDLNGAQSELRIAQRAKQIAEEALRISRLLAQEGRGDPNGVVASEIEVADANDEIARATLHVTMATAHLLSLRGELAPR